MEKNEKREKGKWNKINTRKWKKWSKVQKEKIYKMRYKIKAFLLKKAFIAEMFLNFF